MNKLERRMKDLKIELDQAKRDRAFIIDHEQILEKECQHLEIERDEALAKIERLQNSLYSAEAECERLMNMLDKYGDHLSGCIRSFWQAGAPTESGGYMEKFAGNWYQKKPVDKTPKCDCGFEKVLSRRKT